MYHQAGTTSSAVNEMTRCWLQGPHRYVTHMHGVYIAQVAVGVICIETFDLYCESHGVFQIFLI